MRFSASRLKAHMKCSLHAKYRYEDKLPTRQNAKASFGTIIHQAIAYYYDSHGNFDGALGMFKRLWADPAKAGVEPDVWPKGVSFGSLMGKGIEILKALHEKHKWNNYNLIGTEIPFLVPFGRHELTGFIDLLGTERNGAGRELLTIADHKTNSRKPYSAELALDIQFTTYVYATHQPEFWMGGMDPQFPGLPNGEWLWNTIGKTMDRRAVWNHLWTAQQIDAGPRVTTDFRRMYRVCDQIEQSLKLGLAVPTIGEACMWCDFQDACQLEIPVAISNKTDKTDPTRWH